MNYHFLIFFGLFTIIKLNHAWNVKGQGQGVPRPFWQQSPRGKNQQSSSYQQVSYQQAEASAEPTPVIPQTSFICDGKPYVPGMYADIETDCRVYHVCVEDRKESFFCGDGTVFNQKLLTCDYPKDTNCAASQSYWSANEELGKPGAEPGPSLPISPGKTSRQQYKGGFKQQFIPQKQYQPSASYQQTQQSNYQLSQNTYYSNTDDNGFVNEPVKKIRPTYKVVKTNQQQVNYRPQPSPSRVLISPPKSKITQNPIPLDVEGPVNYEQSDSYFSQQQTLGGWQPSSGPVKQSSASQQHQFYAEQQQNPQTQISQRSYRKSSSYNQQHYSQQSNIPDGWKATNQPGGGYSYNDINEKNIDINIPQTNFDCEGKPYEPGMYADLETGCTIYHVCFDGRKETFACGKGTVFNQKLLVCDYPRSVKCSDSPRFYSSNENLVNENGSWVLKQSSNQQRKVK